MDEKTFECPNCGAVVYPEMTRCPQCGHNMYPEDEEEPQGEAEIPSAGWITSLGAALIGWMIACGIALLVNFIIAAFNTPVTLGIGGITLLLLAGPLGASVGGYVAAGIDSHHGKWIGAISSVLALPILLLFATHWVKVDITFVLTPLVILASAGTILLGALGGWLHHKFTQDTDWKEKWRVRGWEDLLYQDLLRKVRFNGSAADRLIEYERQQNPAATRLQLIQNAIERWERDNR